MKRRADKSGVIEIWEPKYKTNSVLIATYKVTDGDNIIRFTKAPHLSGMYFSASGADIKNSRITTNGRIACYEVPMSKLHRIPTPEECKDADITR